ncbi:MAG: hypothetical protein COA78_07295 [Blastopirellula sp.]|nr:MAG: hypothetical protein COA78_07295 [Blastopirellula sp.]
MSSHKKIDSSKLNPSELSNLWREETEKYVSAINLYIQRGDELGWEDFKESQPKDTREPLVEAVLNAVRKANKDPMAIGTSTHQETRRWVFWKHEKRPLIW